MSADEDLISEDWLRDVGFRWHQLDRQPDKHWLLWCGNVMGKMTCTEDFGIELAPAWWKNRQGDDVGDVGAWHCWLRADISSHYSRFLHVRHLRTQRQLINLFEGLTGTQWNPDRHRYGSVKTAEQIAYLDGMEQRLDQQLLRDLGAKHREIEKDETRGRPLPEHLEAHEKGRPKS